MIIPKNMSLKNWAATLIQDFGTDNVPILTDEKDWKRWAAFVVQENSFSEQGAPLPHTYKDATEFADALFKSMANF